MWFPFTLRQNREALRGRSLCFTPRIESLEDRTVPSTFTVSNLADSGPSSPQQAGLDAEVEVLKDTVLLFFFA